MTSELRINNAKITSTMLGIEDHGIMTAYVFVEGDGWGCGFGGYTLDNYDEKLGKRTGTAYGMNWIKAILDTVGVESWEKLKGEMVRCECGGPGSQITRLGHAIKEKWFDPKQLKLTP